MKYFFTAILIFAAVCLKAQSITPEQAKANIGKSVTVCGLVSGIHTNEKSGVIFINMGGVYPGNLFTIVIFKEVAAKFSYQISTLNKKNICVTGIIKTYKGKPEIVADKESQIKRQ